jgi:4-hydroxythreonine-4-phosphate dehydrogenase
MARPLADKRARPLIALTLGDPAGIGPEIALAALRDAGVRERVRLVLIGPAKLRPADVPRADASGDALETAWLDTRGPSSWRMGAVQAECGRAAIDALRAGHQLAIEGRVDALVTCPVSKQALHLAGEEVEGQTELLGRWSGVARFEMLAVAGRLRVMLLTRHMPLSRAIREITTERVLDHLALLDESLRRFGIVSPHLALAGLNPHAGEGGILGGEDEEILRPAVESARRRGIDVSGPRSPDTVFLEGSRGDFDGVLALYHDQAFIPIKLLSQDGGVTLVAGLPYLRVSPVHGTAFDIAGRGIASPANLIAALSQAAEWARSAGLGVPKRA